MQSGHANRSTGDADVRPGSADQAHPQEQTTQGGSAAERASQPSPPSTTATQVYYPDQLMPIAGEHHLLEPDTSPEQDLRQRYERFSELRESVLLDYGYHTARAYWGDLDDIFWWCERRGFDVHALSPKQFNQYLGLLRRRGYSENTVRRRRTTFRKWQQLLGNTE